MEPDDAKVKSLYKALKLLELFDRENPERGVMELAKLSGMLKSSVYNIISTFSMCGYIEKNPRTGKYRLGLKILELSNVLQNNDETSKVLKPFMDSIAEECNETVYFAIPSGPEAIYIDASHPKGMTFTRSVVGVKVKLYCTAVGKAMLAFLGDELLAEVATSLKPYTPYTLTNEEALRVELEETRKRGYSIDNMEHEYGIRCVGAPVRNQRGDVIGAISISGPSLRVMDEKVTLFSQKLLNAAQEVQMLLK